MAKTAALKTAALKTAALKTAALKTVAPKASSAKAAAAPKTIAASRAAASPKRNSKSAKTAYVLDEQIGFMLRQVWQRHAAIFSREIGTNLTPTQWAALSKLQETGPCSQNQLGRLTAMDVATIKGVIDRLTARGLTETGSDPEDGRRLLVSLTRAGQQIADKAAPQALVISRETLAPLDARERETFMTLLAKLR